MATNNQVIRLEDRKSEVNSTKNDGSYLALETLTLKSNVVIFGKTFRFNYSPTHLWYYSLLESSSFLSPSLQLL